MFDPAGHEVGRGRRAKKRPGNQICIVIERICGGIQILFSPDSPTSSLRLSTAPTRAAPTGHPCPGQKPTKGETCNETDDIHESASRRGSPVETENGGQSGAQEGNTL